MRRGTVIAFCSMGSLILILGIALGSVGPNLDTVKIERDELRFDVDALESQVADLSGERERLKTQVNEQHQALAELKVELERMAEQPHAPAPVPASDLVTTP